MTDNLGGGQLHVYIEDGNPIGDDCIWWGGLLVDINTATFAEKECAKALYDLPDGGFDELYAMRGEYCLGRDD